MDTSNGMVFTTYNPGKSYEHEETQAPSQWALLKWKAVGKDKPKVAIAQVKLVQMGAMGFLRAEFPGYEDEPEDLSFTEFARIWWIKEARARAMLQEQAEARHTPDEDAGPIG